MFRYIGIKESIEQNWLHFHCIHNKFNMLSMDRSKEIKAESLHYKHDKWQVHVCVQTETRLLMGLWYKP